MHEEFHDSEEVEREQQQLPQVYVFRAWYEITEGLKGSKEKKACQAHFILWEHGDAEVEVVRGGWMI